MSLALFNGSYLGRCPTGIGVVARDLVGELDPEMVPLLDPLGGSRPGSIPIRNDLMPELGMRAHIRRLIWTQTKLPEILRKNGSPILLSPLPEAPLLKGTRSVVIAHDLLPLRYPRVNPLLLYTASYVPLVLHSASKVLCNSEATAREINRFLGVPIRKLITIPLGFNKLNLRHLKLKRKPFFLVLGRHNPHKNILRVLKALSRIKNKEIEVWFVGPHDRRYTPKLKKCSEDLGLSSRCRWLPWVSDEERLRLLNSCQALLIASFWEGFGLPALEAMACHTPVIASDAGALPEVVGNAGLLVNPFKIDEISSAMRDILLDSSLRNKLVANGEDRLSLYRWDRSARIVEDVLQCLEG
ncbi:glycosyltransferase family 1 protein [Prochlorococcus sp. MIT 1341]|uniref:glycosyltransferase family 4 protein n=1 Tax=Prochlorococcus sp. MIT 1341 TaxID=3096221 RepID=UPI002A756105|nr:glycosyltransferase family 1 protein [Prochlorococcus sp. MIT 1341]